MVECFFVVVIVFFFFFFFFFFFLLLSLFLILLWLFCFVLFIYLLFIHLLSIQPLYGICIILLLYMTTWPSGLRRVTRNHFSYGGVGSNPAVVAFQLLDIGQSASDIVLSFYLSRFALIVVVICSLIICFLFIYFFFLINYLFIYLIVLWLGYPFSSLQSDGFVVKW